MNLYMPKLGMEMTEGLLARWLVDDGSNVSKDQPIYEIETEKVENVVMCPATGILKRIGVEGQTYEVGALIASLDAAG
ncbi:MAG: biotin/lipoyl-containing protein [Acidimicrobiales bacterium]|jgi:pyruvate/2-oxoglutarate dehydrogenase complex dihydrolipoamide acyltransferase (E2) component